MGHLLIRGNARRIPLADQSVHCVVTSPPYMGLRDYDDPNQIGLEETIEEYVGSLVSVFREVHRVLRNDGTVWLNLGDNYANDTKLGGSTGGKHTKGLHGPSANRLKRRTGLKPKDRMMIPHRVALTLQADGWYVRDEIIWHKRSPMPESVVDRTTKAHEIIFLLAKQPRYFYDAEAVKEPLAESSRGRYKYAFGGKKNIALVESNIDGVGRRTSMIGSRDETTGRNLRSVWTMSTAPYGEAHFATFPPEMPERCIMAGTSESGVCPVCGSPWVRVMDREPLTRKRPNEYTKRTGEEGTGNSCANSVAGVSVVTKRWDRSCKNGCPGGDPVPATVYDPFNGAATTGVAACKLGRNYVGTDLNKDYLAMSARRIAESLRPVSRLSKDKSITPSRGQLSFFGDLS